MDQPRRPAARRHQRSHDADIGANVNRNISFANDARDHFIDAQIGQAQRQHCPAVQLVGIEAQSKPPGGHCRTGFFCHA